MVEGSLYLKISFLKMCVPVCTCVCVCFCLFRVEGCTYSKLLTVVILSGDEIGRASVYILYIAESFTGTLSRLFFVLFFSISFIILKCRH